MAALNHVCMWSEHGWVRVTAEEASRLHPGGTVSAHSGLFMCELCGQYVTLTEGIEKARHFRHSAYEESKTCPERTFGPLYMPAYNANEHELPIRLICEEKDFRLEIGFLYIPQDILKGEKIQSITIKASDSVHYTYSFERLNTDTITYLSVGNLPFEKYEVLSSDRLMAYWPRTVKGIRREGSLFEKQTGNMLTEDSDVLVQKQYYLLTTKCLYNFNPSISVALQNEVRAGWDTWRLYLIEATALDQYAAKFFLSLHYRLTDSPLQIFPIWPLHVRTPYVIKHSTDYLIVHLRGRREKKLSAFPAAIIRSQLCSKYGQISKINCNGRQQLISSGQANVLQYLYFWKEPLEQTGNQPKFQVQDIHGKDIISGQHNELPAREAIKILLPYDGKAIIRRDGIIVDKRPIKAQLTCSIDSIVFGEEIEVHIGLDIVWSASFEEVKGTTYTLDDALLVSTLASFHGNEIPVPHSFGSFIKRLDGYPQTRQWLYQAIRRGTASDRAIKYLISQLSRKKNEGDLL